MLSILIPVYNERILPLVSELLQQARQLDVVFEIVVFDDDSKADIKQENQAIQKEGEVTYQELPKNLGRSAIRNALGNAAQYQYLLFMDGDAFPDNPFFLKNYLTQLDEYTVLVGGTAYADTPPSGCELHWLVGTKREVVPAFKRNQRPYHGFSSFNFLVSKKIFSTCKFDETIREYGHEDTLYGMALKKERVTILHLDNPLIHNGLDAARVFLDKRNKAIQNLIKLQQVGKAPDTKLLRFDRWLGMWGLRGVVLGLYGFFEKPILKNLYGDKPEIWLFFWYSVAHLISGRGRPN